GRCRKRRGHHGRRAGSHLRCRRRARVDVVRGAGVASPRPGGMTDSSGRAGAARIGVSTRSAGEPFCPVPATTFSFQVVGVGENTGTEVTPPGIAGGAPGLVRACWIVREMFSGRVRCGCVPNRAGQMWTPPCI